jgi:hypothetical protein
VRIDYLHYRHVYDHPSPSADLDRTAVCRRASPIKNLQWLFSDANMDEVLIGRPVLHALGMDAAKHLSAARESLQDLDCSEVPSVAAEGKLSRLLIRRAEALQTCTSEPLAKDPDPVRELGCTKPTEDIAPPSVNHGNRDVDPFDDSGLLDPSSASSQPLFEASMLKMVEAAGVAGLSSNRVRELHSLVFRFSDIWRIGLCPGPPAKLPPRRISLKSGATPVRVRVRNYPADQRAFLTRLSMSWTLTAWSTATHTQHGARPHSSYQDQYLEISALQWISVLLINPRFLHRGPCHTLSPSAAALPDQRYLLL